jgi:hypothetical protein
MTIFNIILVIATAIAGSILGVPYLWWNVIFAEGLLSLEAFAAMIGTVAFWGGAFVAIERHDVHWLWRGAAVVGIAVAMSALVQHIKHRTPR